MVTGNLGLIRNIDPLKLLGNIFIHTETDYWLYVHLWLQYLTFHKLFDIEKNKYLVPKKLKDILSSGPEYFLDEKTRNILY